MKLVSFWTWSILLVLSSSITFAQRPVFSTQLLPNCDSWIGMAAQSKTVYLLGLEKGSSSSGRAVLAQFTGSTWKNITPVISENGKYDTLVVSAGQSDLTFDGLGRIWITGRVGSSGQLWCFNGDSWSRYSVQDALNNNRIYTSICCDSSGGIWMYSQLIGLSHMHSDVYRFDGSGFSSVLKSDSMIYTCRCQCGACKPLCTLSDGTVLINRLGIDTTTNDILLFKNLQLVSQTRAKEPDGVVFAKSVSSVTASGLDAVFTYNYIIDASIVRHGGGFGVLHPSGEWSLYGLKEGLPKGFNGIEVPILTCGAVNDYIGDTWISSVNHIFRLTATNTVQVPSWSWIAKNSLAFSSQYWTDNMIDSFYGCLWDSTKMGSVNFGIPVLTSDGSLWFLFGAANVILRIDSKALASATAYDDQKLLVIPNPNNGSLLKIVGMPTDDGVAGKIEIRSIVGALVYAVGDTPINGASMAITLPEALANGAYTISWSDGRFSFAKTFVVVK